MISVQELENQLSWLQKELYLCIHTNNNNEITRLLIGISATKDELLERYRNSYSGSVISPIVRSNVDVFEYTPPELTCPLRVVK